MNLPALFELLTSPSFLVPEARKLGVRLAAVVGGAGRTMSGAWRLVSHERCWQGALAALKGIVASMP